MNTTMTRWLLAMGGAVTGLAVIAGLTLLITGSTHHSAPAAGAAAHTQIGLPSAGATPRGNGQGTNGQGSSASGGSGSGGSGTSGSGTSGGGSGSGSGGSGSGSGGSGSGSGGSGSGGSGSGGTTVTSIPVPTEVIGDSTRRCLVGYVWRKAWPGDYACVTLANRDQAIADNTVAVSRVQPGGGPYGIYTCKQGYVWRQAVQDDYVCVTGAVRAQTLADNAQINNRILMLNLRATDWFSLHCVKAVCTTTKEYMINGDQFNVGGYYLYAYNYSGTLLWTKSGNSVASTTKPGGTFAVKTSVRDCSATNATSTEYVIAVDLTTGYQSAKLPLDTAC